MGVVIRRAMERNQEKTGMEGVLGKTNGSPGVSGHFLGGKNRATGRLFRDPEGEEDYQEYKRELNEKEGGLSSFIEPRSMAWTQPHTEMQFVTETNQSEVESARRLEVPQVETL